MLEAWREGGPIEPHIDVFFFWKLILFIFIFLAIESRPRTSSLHALFFYSLRSYGFFSFGFRHFKTRNGRFRSPNLEDKTILDFISFRLYYLGHGDIQRSSGWFSISCHILLYYDCSSILYYIIVIRRDGGTSLGVSFIFYFIISLGLARSFEQWIPACAACCGFVSVGRIR